MAIPPRPSSPSISYAGARARPSLETRLSSETGACGSVKCPPKPLGERRIIYAFAGGGAAWCRASVLAFELRLVLGDEGFDLVGEVEELGPLFFVERDGESTEPVDRNTAFFADFERDSFCRAFFERF